MKPITTINARQTAALQKIAEAKAARREACKHHPVEVVFEKTQWIAINAKGDEVARSADRATVNRLLSEAGLNPDPAVADRWIGKSEITYTGKVSNQVTGEVFRTRRYPTWESAHHAAERLAKRRSVWSNCSIAVE